MKRLHNTTRTLFWGLGFLGLSLSLLGCDRKENAFSEIKPLNPLVKEKPTKVAGQSLARDRKIFRKSSTLTLADANGILQGFVYKAKSTTHMKRRGRVLTLRESYEIKQNARGSFVAKLTNNKGWGYEVVWTGKELFTNPNKRGFRSISRDVQRAHQWQQRGFGRWRSMVAMFGEHLQLTEDGMCERLGRACRNYRIQFRANAPLRGKKEGTTWAGNLPEHTRGDAARRKRRMQSASGRIHVDRQTGLVMEFQFQGSYQIGEGSRVGTVTLKMEGKFIHQGSPVVPAPKELVTAYSYTEPKDPFAHKTPFYFQSRRKKRKKRR